ncbi:hypothetical protein [Actinoplanes sp. NPDC049802]|uniref:hypothetical protein n=1 Tax=Actinoplanes sp. NPDC049802 TaxID=3154742 RepID=UPI0033E31582
MSRGRPAARPDDVRPHRPRVLEQAGLVVTHLDEKGRRAAYDFAVLPVHQPLARGLAEQFAQFVGPGGTWRSVATSGWAFEMLRLFAQFLSEQRPQPQDLPAITPAIWAAWRLATGERQSGLLKFTAGFLRGHPRLPQATRDLIMRRLPKETVRETAYTAQEFDAIKVHTTQTFRAALLRIRANAEHLRRWRAGEFNEPGEQWHLGRLLDHIARTGRPPTYTAIGGEQRIRYRDTIVLGGSRADVTWARLFLTPREARALLMLMVCTYGWNASSIAELDVPQIVSGEDENAVVYRVELHKPRRHVQHRYESRNLTDWGASSPGRLISEAIEATAPGRAALALAGTPSSRLLVWHTRDTSAAPVNIEYAVTLDDLTNTPRGGHRRVPFGQGGIEVNLRRLRKTFVLANQPELIQHSRDTHDRVYVLPDPQTKQQAQAVIEAGVNDAVEFARAHFRATLSRAETDAADDTATASCADYHHSPFSEHGTGCRASFLLCFACPNAVITPRHLPRLALLHRALSDLRAVLPADQWLHDWDQHHQRLGGIRRAPDFTVTEWDDALAAATDEDRQMIESLLTKGSPA